MLFFPLIKRDENNAAGTNERIVDKATSYLIFDEGLMNFIVSSDAARFSTFFRTINIQSVVVIKKKDFP